MRTVEAESNDLIDLSVSWDLSSLQGTLFLPYRGWECAYKTLSKSMQCNLKFKRKVKLGFTKPNVVWRLPVLPCSVVDIFSGHLRSMSIFGFSWKYNTAQSWSTRFIISIRTDRPEHTQMKHRRTSSGSMLFVLSIMKQRKYMPKVRDWTTSLFWK